MPVSCFSWCRTKKEDPVNEIDLSNSALHDVPTSIFLHERTLDTLILNSNTIHDLPLPLFYCQNLQFLNLSDNDIAMLPAAVGYLVNLHTLDLSRNSIQDIHESIRACKKMKVLNLSMNPLRQFPDTITHLIHMEELYLNDANLTHLPANVGRFMLLRILELRDNRLSTLPRAVARFSKLIRLDIGQNDFTFLPEVIRDLPALEELWVDLNGTIAIPFYLADLKNLNHLDVSENILENIPRYIGECTLITEMTLSANYLKCLPEEIGLITNLVSLKLEFNDLTELPETIGDLSILEELNVSHNKLETIPSSIGLLRKLVCLIIDTNQLKYLPPEIGSCASLRVLTVQNNLLRSIPAEVGNLHNLAVLSLTNNLLTCLPLSILNMVNLKALWLVYNQSKPLTPLVKELDPLTGTLVLTCYLFPQISPGDEQQTNESHGQNANCKPKATERPKIRFSANTSGPFEKVGLLNRAPTPYPKKLRELAKSARAVVSQTMYSSAPEQFADVQCCELPVVNGNGMGDQVRTAVVKKHQPTLPLVEENIQMPETSKQAQLLPPPYHIAATFSKQASLFHNNLYMNKEERRRDIDTKTLSSLKDELLHNLPPNECQMSQSEQSGSLELVYTGSGQQQSVTISDVDSAFVDNTEVGPKSVDYSKVVNGNDGTYSAFPGIVIPGNASIERVPSENGDYFLYDSSRYPISKVSNWLSSKTKPPTTTEGCEFINMYPCENNEELTNEPNLSCVVMGEKQKDSNAPPTNTTMVSKLPWLFGVHKNPKVIEVTVNKYGRDLGFEIAETNTGVYVTNITKTGEVDKVLKVGDKILQVDGIEVKNELGVLQLLSALQGSDVLTMMISRPT